VHYGDRDAGVPGLRFARDREDARQPGEPVAAKRIVDQLVGDDAGVVRAVSDTGKCGFAKCPRVVEAEPYRPRPVSIEVIGGAAHRATIEPAAGSVKTGQYLVLAITARRQRRPS
jgi:hypothetical protein